MHRKSSRPSTVRSACACTAGLSALLAASAALAQEGPNCVRDGGFEGAPGSDGAWIKRIYRAPVGGDQCGGLPVHVASDPVNMAARRNGFARIAPLYIQPSAGLCAGAFPCGAETFDYTVGLCELVQDNLDPGAGDFVELSFDFRMIDLRPTIPCRTGCDQVFPVAEVSLFEGGGYSPAQVFQLFFDGSAATGQWQRARLGYRRNLGEPFALSIKLLASIATSVDLNAFGATLDIDNVRVTSFDGNCVEAWECPVEPVENYCTPWPTALFLTLERTLAVSPASADMPAGFVCERPCAPACQGDVNGDGVVSGADLGVVLGVFGTNDPAADLNDDGIVSGADLGIVLGNWGCGG
jgi:hypothetical protein